LRPGKVKRREEVEVHRRFYEALGIPIVGEITGEGTVEGGDCFWLNSSTLAVGRGFRSNENGIHQMRAILSDLDINVVQFDLPPQDDPDACLHLMSVVSPLDHDLALIYEPLMPNNLQGVLKDFGYDLLSAPVNEFELSYGLSLNVLAVSERNVIAIEGFDETRALMENAGCVVSTFPGDELCIPCEGGPTCLTRPVLRK
jgi:dimethylargininase